MEKLGQFDLVYSVYSMHHWQNPESAILHLFKVINENGILYLGDLKRVWWLYYLPSKSRDIEQVRASYAPGEIKKMLGRNRISRYEMQSLFPFFLQSIVVKNQ
ncbi:MAG: hypothetical protein A2170_08880 [Deltaproteobacteria bacterium RBG_13_53_10]|nr:MAG: hypothetical protein A2170_08880 [Deltaproteobacteria bacterium RBG_13_53_10]